LVDAAKLLSNPAALTNMVRRIALGAGEIVMDYYDGTKDMEVDHKHDDSPVTLADRDTEQFIQMSLQQLLPDVPVIGEEAISMGSVTDISNAKYFWLVDALDGTKNFIRGGDEFTVNIALIKDEAPVLGVVYAPALGELYAGHAPGSAIRWNEDTNKEKPIQVRDMPREGLSVVASVSHGDNARLEDFLSSFKVNKIIKRSSSLKICAIAAGRADIYPRFGPTSEWDTAAADAVLRAAGGYMTDTEGAALRYGGHRPKFLNPEFIASSFAWFDLSED